MNANFDFNSKTGLFEPSPTSLALYVSNREVGTVTVDLASYIGQKSKTERALIGSNKLDKVFSYSEEKVLHAARDQITNFKNAQIIFKITADSNVDTIKTPQQNSPSPLKKP